jgi:hypothetical protein
MWTQYGASGTVRPAQELQYSRYCACGGFIAGLLTAGTHVETGPDTLSDAGELWLFAIVAVIVSGLVGVALCNRLVTGGMVAELDTDDSDGRQATCGWIRIEMGALYAVGSLLLIMAALHGGHF